MRATAAAVLFVACRPSAARAPAWITSEGAVCTADGCADVDAVPDGVDVLRDGRVVFVARARTGTHIAVVHPGSGAAPKVLTSRPGFHDRPIVDPTGTRIAYVAAAHGLPSLFVIGVDGGPPRQITNVGLALGPPGPDRLPADRTVPPQDRESMSWDERGICWDQVCVDPGAP